LGGGGFGGFGIEAFGGKNGSGTMARAGEFHGDVEVTGCLSVSPNTNAHFQVGSCLSDMRLKKNIQPFPAALDKVAQLQPVTYDWRTEEYPQFRFSSGREIGLIAQEVEKEFPEMVSTDKAGYKRVNYGELPYLMLQAIRELKAEKDELQEEMKTKEAQWEERFRAQEQRVSLQEMQQQMAALEARLALVESRGGSIQASDATREIPKRSEGGGPLEAQARF
jgi:DNA repair exonuclease SbcCD ATPase subunit